MQTEKHPSVETPVTLDGVLALAQRLPLVDQARLVARLAPMVERALDAAEPPSYHPLRTPIRGLLADLGPAPSAEEIDGARREMWAGFGTEE